MPDNSLVRYPLGSHRRWIETLLFLAVPFLIAGIVFFLLAQAMHRSGEEALLIIVSASLTFLFQSWLSSESDSHLPWMSRIIVNLAYGRADEDGIYYREWFSYHFVSWKAIARLEYWPDSDGRILLHLFSRRSPVVFLPDQTNHHMALSDSPGTVDFISRKLNETWPGKSTFLICFENAQTQKPGKLTALLRKLSLRQRAVVNALLAALCLFAFLGYGEFRFGVSDKIKLRIIGLLLIVILASRAGMYFWQKNKTSAKDQQHKLEEL